LPVEQNVSIDLQVKAYIPQEYISDPGIKIDFYQRIYAARNKEELAQIREELTDRFGQPPQALDNLLKIAGIKVVAADLKVQSIAQEKDIIKIKMEKDHTLTGFQLMEVARKFRRQLSFSTAGTLEIMVNIRNIQRQEILNFLEEVVMELSSIAHKETVLV